MYCTKCGKRLGDEFNFCPECGTKKQTTPNQLNKDTVPKQKPVQQPSIYPQMSPLLFKGTEKKGNPTLKAFGIISIILGPVIALIMAMAEYYTTYNRHTRIWGSRGAEERAMMALEAIAPTLITIVVASIIVGIIILVVEHNTR